MGRTGDAFGRAVSRVLRVTRGRPIARFALAATPLALGLLAVGIVGSALSPNEPGGPAGASPAGSSAPHDAEVARDPEALAGAAVRAAYSRDYAFFQQFASVGLRAYYGHDEGAMERDTARMLDATLPEGEAQVLDAELQTDLFTSNYYLMEVREPDGARETLAVTLVEPEDEAGSYAVCGMNKQLPPGALGESAVGLVGNMDTCP